MAWRLHDRVVRGEIDNRQRGHVHGKIWLIGRPDSIALNLTGNCWPDLAGCVLKFENPSPVAAKKEDPDLNAQQDGVVGDITASRKVRVFDLPLEEALRIGREGGTPPEHMANSVYIEWFSEANGRVVIESADFRIGVSPPAWTLTLEEEQQQAETNRQAMLDWMHRLGETMAEPEPGEFDSEANKQWNEFDYEKLLRESDERTEKYGKLLEKYEGHPDQERIVAREMGWSWLEEALEADERGALPRSEEPEEIPPLEPNPATQGIDWVRDEHGRIKHPLQKRAFESAMTMWHYCDDRGLLKDSGDADLDEMIFQAQTVGAKLAGALNSLSYDEGGLRDGGFVVALLKRALSYVHASMAAAEKVAAKELIDAERLSAFRKEWFEIREEILRLMERFRSEGGGI
jgi:hypothetical protein